MFGKDSVFTENPILMSLWGGGSRKRAQSSYLRYQNGAKNSTIHILNGSNQYTANEGLEVLLNNTSSFNSFYYAIRICMQHSASFEKETNKNQSEFSKLVISKDIDAVYKYRSKYYLGLKAQQLIVNCDTPVLNIIEGIGQQLPLFAETVCKCEERKTLSCIFPIDCQQYSDLNSGPLLMKCDCGEGLWNHGLHILVFILTSKIIVEVGSIPKSVKINKVAYNLSCVIGSNQTESLPTSYRTIEISQIDGKYVQYMDGSKKPVSVPAQRKIRLGAIFFSK
jgi:hypothetical protein